MVDFYETAFLLQSTINVANNLAKHPHVDQTTIYHSQRMLRSCAEDLYSSRVMIADAVTTQERILLYRDIIAVTSDVRAALAYLSMKLNVDMVSLFVPRDKLVMSLVDPALLEELPRDREELLVYQLTLISDVLNNLIREKTISSDTSMVSRYIYKQYNHVIQLLSEFLSFQGRVISDNITKLWNRGYVTVDRSTQRIPPCIEVTIPNLVTLQIPIRGKY